MIGGPKGGVLDKIYPFLGYMQVLQWRPAKAMQKIAIS